MVSGDAFAAFFTELHGYPPFAWQRRLAQEVADSGCWPNAIAMPTGFGKTAVIEIAVFALAVNPALPRRTVLVVDRRIVVDHAYATATHLANALATPQNYGPAVAGVAKGLLERGGESPLTTAILRGGMYREPAWVRNPAQPMIICSTVDQVGSRLLHRGYGVSSRMLSVHAGFLAYDTLCILDEAHISEPFRQTLAAVNRYQAIAEQPLARPIVAVVMSATLNPRSGDTQFTVTDEDTLDPLLHRRRSARKLVTISKASNSNMANKIAIEAMRVTEPGSTILVVVNRVHRTREVERHIRSRNRQAHILVITGRSRPVERDMLIEGYRNRLFSGRDRLKVTGEPPLYVIATQAIEVGADIDADALVTEACPMPTLLQRVARVDRLGERGESTVVVVGDTDLNKLPKHQKPDPLYGWSLMHTWLFLDELDYKGPVDLGNVGWEKIAASTDNTVLDTLYPPQPDAPVMMPIHCDLWVQTSPLPVTSPDPSLFLRGLDAEQTDIQIVWRADLAADRPETWGETIEYLPPVAGEALSLPISTARLWLSKNQDDWLSDIDGAARSSDHADREGNGKHMPILVWRGPTASYITTNPNELKPGDTIVVPAVVGGCDRWGWDPEWKEDREATADIADVALARSSRPVVARIHPAVPAFWEAVAHLHMPQSEHGLIEVNTLVQQALDNADSPDPLIADALSSLRSDSRKTVHPHPSGVGWIITGTRPSGVLETSSPGDDEAACVGKPVTLDDHLDHVTKVARAFADSVGLPDNLRDDIATAATFHDLGKADRRQQAVYHDGDRIRASRGPLIAKSTKPNSSGNALRAAQRSAGIPSGYRHEFLSAHLVEQAQITPRICHDEDLVVHLIATHHGLCRPLPPAIADPAPITVAVPRQGHKFSASSDLVQDGLPFHHLGRNNDQRFWRLVRRYGWWGLSYLEAILRLADHRASEHEISGGVR